MFDFSDDEFIFLLIAMIAGGWGVFAWLRCVLIIPRLRDELGSSMRLGLIALPALCVAIVALVVWNLADPTSVSGHVDYFILFLSGAACWFSLTVGAVSGLGIHFRYDVVEAGNRAAAIAIAGTALATTLIYAGGNIGAGPTIWTTLLPASVASATLLMLWFLIETFAGVSDSITIDRDQASGIRIAGWAIATGI